MPHCSGGRHQSRELSLACSNCGALTLPQAELAGWVRFTFLRGVLAGD